MEPTSGRWTAFARAFVLVEGTCTLLYGALGLALDWILPSAGECGLLGDDCRDGWTAAHPLVAAAVTVGLGLALVTGTAGPGRRRRTARLLATVSQVVIALWLLIPSVGDPRAHGWALVAVVPIGGLLLTSGVRRAMPGCPRESSEHTP